MQLLMQGVIVGLALAWPVHGESSLRGSQSTTGNSTRRMTMSAAECSCCNSNGCCPGGGCPCDGTKNAAWATAYDALLANPSCLEERLTLIGKDPSQYTKVPAIGTQCCSQRCFEDGAANTGFWQQKSLPYQKLDFSPCPLTYPSSDTRYCGPVEHYCNGLLGHGYKLSGWMRDYPQYDHGRRSTYSNCLRTHGHFTHGVCGNSDYAIREGYPEGCTDQTLLDVGICRHYCYHTLLPSLMDVKKESERINKDNVEEYYCGAFTTTAWKDVVYTPTSQGQLWDGVPFDKPPRR